MNLSGSSHECMVQARQASQSTSGGFPRRPPSIFVLIVMLNYQYKSCRCREQGSERMLRAHRLG